MRRLKRSTALLQSSWDRLRGYRAWPTRSDFARIKSRGGFVEATAGCLADPSLQIQFRRNILPFSTSRERSSRLRRPGSGQHCSPRYTLYARCALASAPALVRWHRSSGVRILQQQPAPRSPRWRISLRLCVLQRRLEKELVPSAAGIERSDAVNKERIMFPIGRANQRPP